MTGPLIYIKSERRNERAHLFPSQKEESPETDSNEVAISECISAKSKKKATATKDKETISYAKLDTSRLQIHSLKTVSEVIV